MIATAIAVAYAFPNSRKPAHALARQLGAPPHAFSSSVTVTPYCFVWLSLEQKMAHQQGRAMAARFPEDQELQQASLTLVRSEERRVGKGCARACRFRWCTYP